MLLQKKLKLVVLMHYETSKLVALEHYEPARASASALAPPPHALHPLLTLVIPRATRRMLLLSAHLNARSRAKGEEERGLRHARYEFACLLVLDLLALLVHKVRGVALEACGVCEAAQAQGLIH
jgi:hypothetical protein